MAKVGMINDIINCDNTNFTDTVYGTNQFFFNYSRITGQGKPTLVNRGIYFGFSLPIFDSDDEELFACHCIPGDWDSSTNATIIIGGWLDTANTNKNFKLQVSWDCFDIVNNEVVPGSGEADVEIETATGTAAQYTSFKVEFPVAVGDNSCLPGSPFAIRIRRIAASEDEITGEFVVEGVAIKYIRNRSGSIS